MLEATEWILITCILAVMSGIFCGVWSVLGRYLADRRVAAVEADVERIVMTLNSRKGEEARTQSKEEDQALMAQVAADLQSGKPPADVLKGALAKNPQAALRIAKKLGIGI